MLSGSQQPDESLVDAAWSQIAHLQVAEQGASGSRAGSRSRLRLVGDSELGSTVPGYRIVSEIKRGGQGIVYLAVQESTGRKVAIKVMRSGPSSTTADLARFDLEVELLSRLRHPNIIAIQDRGRTGESLYYVMDYVSGQSLDKHLAGLASEVRVVLGLFARICDAVNVAHLHGIIHRDLKPSNVLIDEFGQPKVLDFGLARMSSGGGLGEPAKELTIVGEFVGSLPWASPEQVAGKPDQIDIRTDVYSLGVMLYEALTGGFPYPVTGAMHETISHITETSPARPSSRGRGLDDEVDTILLKCLAKEPDRRYQSAGELARDIGHYLRGEPIQAKRDSTLYLIRKMFSRHRAPAIFMATLLVLIVASAITTSVLYRQSITARNEAQKRRERAEIESKKSEDVQRLLLAMLESISPWVAAGGDTSVLEHMIEEAGVRSKIELADQPEVRASVHNTLGLSYLLLCRYELARKELDSALEIRRQILGDEHLDVAATLDHLATLNLEQDNLDAAIALAGEALNIQRSQVGEQSWQAAESCVIIARASQNRGEVLRAEKTFKTALAIQGQTIGEDSPPVVDTLIRLGDLQRQIQRFDESSKTFERALTICRTKLKPGDPRQASVRGAIGALQREQGLFGESEQNLSEALDLCRKIYRGPHMETVTILNSLGALRNTQHRYREALPLLVSALEMRRALLGKDTPSSAFVLCNLGASYKNQERFVEADAMYKLALPLAVEGHYRRLEATILNNFAALRLSEGKLLQAEAYNREALAIRRTIFGDEHIDTAQSVNNLAAVLSRQGKRDEAEKMHREVLRVQRKLLGDNSYAVGQAATNLAQTLGLRDPQNEEAVSLFREAMHILSQAAPPTNAWVIATKANLGSLLVARGEYAEAEPLLKDASEQLASGAKSLVDARTVQMYQYRLYTLWGKPEQAAKYKVK